MVINFEKYSGSGNDFIIVDNRKSIIKNRKEFAINTCKRQIGIGADGLVLMEMPQNVNVKKADFRMRIINKDGSEAEMCGNAARCIAQFAYRNKITSKSMVIDTDAGLIDARVLGGMVTRVRLTDPQNVKLNYPIHLETGNKRINFINTGVPHVCVIANRIDNIDLAKLGREIRYHKDFKPAGTNVNLVKVISKNRIQVRTYERGVEAETLACGTGVIASAIITALLGKTEQPVKVTTAGGDALTIYFKKEGDSIIDTYLEGRVSLVYKGITGPQGVLM